MVGPNQAKTCVGHKMDSIEGQAPIIYVRSTGTLRTRESFTYDFPTFGFEVIIYVQQAKDAWTDAMACDRVDLLESLLAQVIETYRVDPTWILLEYGGESEVTEISLGTGGNRYYKECVPLVVKLGES